MSILFRTWLRRTRRWASIWAEQPAQEEAEALPAAEAEEA